jgi:protein-disulfide isomerase
MAVVMLACRSNNKYPIGEMFMIRRSHIVFGLFFASFCLVSLVWAEDLSTEDLGKQIKELNKTVQSMQRDLQDIKDMLVRRAPATPPEEVVFDLGDNPARGERTAKLILIEFSDYQCTYCARYIRDMAP